MPVGGADDRSATSKAWLLRRRCRWRLNRPTGAPFFFLEVPLRPGSNALSARGSRESDRNPLPPAQPPPEAAVADVHGLAVHERAAADDVLQAARLALLDRRVGDAPFAEGAVEPDAVRPFL